ncbi:MAG: DUF1295 domain-containing protein [Gloeobacteraceae cyanobacterium ES-bin-144]|nr:DUF1295 domain-containing protein [Verrucomicrobiales bacterium]
MNTWLLFGIGSALMVCVFTAAWAWARRINNYSIVDAVWAYGIGLTGSLWLMPSAGGSLKQTVAVALLVSWSLRLGFHLQERIRKAHPEEDARYKKLRGVWHDRVSSAFLWFFLAQAGSVVVLALPFLAISNCADQSWGIWETAGLCACLIGIFGEALADSQMKQFKISHKGSATVCQTGLWRYSRHPNYFFEAVIWCGFYLYACGSPWGWATFHAPFIIIYLLLRVTGIPPTEAAAVLRKGEAYRLYQKTTSAFIPWPPKSENSNTNTSSP